MLSSEICKYTHFFTINLALTNKLWAMEKTTYTFEFSVKSSIRIRYFSSCAKKKVKFCCPVLSVRHNHISVMELGHLLTHSGLTYPEVSSKVCHDSFCQLANSVSLPWVIYYEAFYLHSQHAFLRRGSKAVGPMS